MKLMSNDPRDKDGNPLEGEEGQAAFVEQIDDLVDEYDDSDLKSKQARWIIIQTIRMRREKHSPTCLAPLLPTRGRCRAVESTGCSCRGH